MKIFPHHEFQRMPDCHGELPRAHLFNLPAGFGPGCMSTAEAEFVWAVVRLVKPSRALETGCEGGLTTCAIAQALADNGAGILDTVELEPTWRAHTAENLSRLGLADRVALHPGNSLDFIRTENAGDAYQFALLDSSIATRLEEFDLLMERALLAPGSFVLLHDTNPHHPMRAGAPLFVDYIATRPYAPRIRTVDLPSPRGLTLIEVR